jgi:hypothetical protein
MVTPWVGGRGYHVKLILKEMIGRCRELKLYVKGSDRRVKINFAIVLCKHCMDSLYRQRFEVEM